MSPFWISAFLDLPATVHADGAEFWSRVTGYALSPARGGAGEFATLVPPGADDFLRVQRIDGPRSRVHLDLHVAEPHAAAAELTALGARVVADRGHLTMGSPGGLPFCLVTHPASARPAPSRWPGGHASLVDQVCLDIPPSRYDEERAFWAAATGLEARPLEDPELDTLHTPRHAPLRLLFQRLDDEQPSVTAHLDLAATDPAAEVARHRSLGAEVLGTGRGWTVLRDPAGSAYCVTPRDPVTGGR